MNNNRYDCILIGFKNYPLNKRIMVAKNNEAALNYCKHEYLTYRGKYLFYDEFLTHLCNDGDNLRFSIHEIPYLGIAYLHNYLSQKGLRVKSYNYFDYSMDEIEKIAYGNKVKFVAISSVFYTNPIPLIDIVKRIRGCLPEVKIAIGGAYIFNKYKNVDPDSFEKEILLIGADFVICEAQGEQALYNICQYVNGKGSLEHIKNAFMIENGNIHKFEFENEHNDINDNIIDFTSLDHSLLFSTMNIRTSRGCPNRCSFCNYPLRNPKLELQNEDIVMKQLLQINQLDAVKNIVFIDDSFNMPLQRLKSICKAMIDSGFSKEWYSYFKMSHYDEEVIYLMKNSGCGGVFLGIESADNTVLMNMNKRSTVEQYTEALKLFEKYEIPTFAYMMVGFPGETRDSILKNIEFLNNHYVTFYTVNLWYCEPNTPVYKRREEYQLIGDGFDWKHYSMDALEASKYMDLMYERITNSIYIPGENFSFWGVPYLRGKGFTLEQIKQILILIKKYKQGLHYNPVSMEDTVAEIQNILYCVRGV